MHSVFIDGAAGTTGLEIHERLADRPEFDLIVLDDAKRKDSSARREALNDADFAILCLPDDAAREAVALVSSSSTRIIDASSAHRIDPEWVYGFPELIGAELVAAAMRVSNPGCYPTGFLALVAPLVRAGLLPVDYPYSVNAVSGYSGGGKALIERFDQKSDIAFRAYGLALDHKHLPEMQHHAGLEQAPIFSPSVIAGHRGMLVDVPVSLRGLPVAPTPHQLREELARFYSGEPLVTVHPEMPDLSELLLREGTPAWDGIELFVAGNNAGTQARLIARLDNLGKGASGAAVQSLNLMAGLPEATALQLP